MELQQAPFAVASPFAYLGRLKVGGPGQDVLVPLVVGRVPPPPAGQQEALLALFNQMGGAQLRAKSGWGTANIAAWHGVTVNEGHVVGLQLPNNRLTGSPPPELQNLRSLRLLDARSALVHIDLSDNQLSGAVPDLTPISLLRNLRLARNRL